MILKNRDSIVYDPTVFLRLSSCQLPVFFLFDTSQAMEGVLAATMQQGFLTMRNRLLQHEIAKYQVYLRCIALSEKPPFEPLSPVALFEPPSWVFHTACLWRPALAELSRSLTFDLLVDDPTDPRGYYIFPPLIIFLLGSAPVDQWSVALSSLISATTYLKPISMVLLTDKSMRADAHRLSSTVLLLEQGRGEYMSNFFLWVTQWIESICERHFQGEKGLIWSPLPYGVQILQ